LSLRLTFAASLCITLALPAGVAAQSAEEEAFARAHLEALQERSFRNGREYCGFFGRDKTGKMVAVKARPGSEDECTAYWPHPRITVFASYHTHGIWDGVSDSEVPSVQDVEGDMADGIDGYLSTPGGRFWFIDGETGVSRQLCGERCLLTDHRYNAEVEGVVPEVLTLEELKERQSD
jgi:hypothetical protein